MSVYQNYLSNAYTPYYGYGQRPIYGQYQQPMQQTLQQAQMPMQQQPQQPVAQNNVAPINDIRFVTADEAKGFMVLPYQNALLIDTQNKTAWLKMADGLGQSTTKLFKYAETEQQKANSEQGAQNQDLSGFVKKDELAGFATKDDMQAIVQAISNLQRQIKINEVEKEVSADVRKNT